MAENKTKADLEKENEELREKVANNAPLRDTTWYDEQLSQRNKKIELLEGELQGKKDKENRRKRENDLKKSDNDREEAILANMIQKKKGGRFTLRDRPTRFPNRSLDGTADGPVFDLGIQLENFDGGVFVPLSWIVDMGRSVGMLTGEEADKLKAELNTKKAQNEASVNLAEELKNGIDTLISEFRTNLDSVSPASVDTNEGTADTQGNDSSPDGQGIKSDETTGQNGDANISENPDGVSSDSGDAASGPAKSESNSNNGGKSKDENEWLV